MRTCLLLAFPLLLCGCCRYDSRVHREAMRERQEMLHDMREAREEYRHQLRKAQEDYRRRLEDARSELRRSRERSRYSDYQ